MSLALTLACVLCVCGLLVGELRHNFALRAATKTSASLLFLAVALSLGAADAGAPGLFLLVALVFSLIGDVLLLWKDKRLFLLGLVAFLTGHLAYAAMFWALGVNAVQTGVAALVLGVFAAVVWRWLGPHTGRLAPAVAAYIAVISLMVALAAGAADARPARLGLLAAATLFFLSDLCVARDRFIAPGPNNRMVGLPLYYAAQLAFAYALASA